MWLLHHQHEARRAAWVGFLGWRRHQLCSRGPMLPPDRRPVNRRKSQVTFCNFILTATCHTASPPHFILTDTSHTASLPHFILRDISLSVSTFQTLILHISYCQSAHFIVSATFRFPFNITLWPENKHLAGYIPPPPPTLCRTLRTLQSSPQPLCVLAFCAMAATAACKAGPSSLCRALLPRMIIGRLAEFSTWVT